MTRAERKRVRLLDLLIRAETSDFQLLQFQRVETSLSLYDRFFRKRLRGRGIKTRRAIALSRQLDIFLGLR